MSSHHGSHPLAKQREEFLGVKASTPMEQKAQFTPETCGSAAAYEAWKMSRAYFEVHDAHRAGGKVSHIRGKEIISELAANQVIKLVDERQLPFPSDKDRKKFIVSAQGWAVKDAKRALRESGFYTNNELEVAERDEIEGHSL